MKVPQRKIGSWAKEIIDMCYASRSERIQRGALYRNLYLTGDENGDPQIYPKTFAFIDSQSSLLYSPVDLRCDVEYYGQVGPVDRAKGRAVASDLHRRIRECNLDTLIEDAVSWSLVKGKTLVKLNWADGGFDPYLVQPEMFGVLNESVSDLDRQSAFVHSTYMTIYQFEDLVERRSDKKELLRAVTKYLSPSKTGDDTQNQDQLRQVIIGGLYPYQTSGGGQTKNRGMVDWLSGPSPNLGPEVLAKILRLDELWVWNSAEKDWTTIQVVGDVIVEGKIQHKNIFADAVDTDLSLDHKDNPLNGHHPFIEFCPNRLDGYFYGRSELCNVALLQKTLNVSIDGINMLLRLQEKPPRAMIGSTSVNQNAYAKMNKPGGWLSDANPNAKIQTLAPEIPQGLYERIHETLEMFNDMAGATPVMQGRGESGVRAQGHAETLTRNSSPRFKDRALLVERSVEETFGLALDLCKAHVPTELTAWLMPGKGNVETLHKPDPDIEQPPAPGMEMIKFRYANLDKDAKVVVDSHSGSPAFSHDARALLFDLFKAGAVKPEQLIKHTHPPGEDELVSDLEMTEVEKAQFAQAHPEVALQAIEGGKHKKK
jgi:hypothetical protein